LGFQYGTKTGADTFNEEARMKLNYLVFALSIFLLSCSAVSSEVKADKFEKAYKKADNVKTWVVYDAEEGHMSVGDKFKIKGGQQSYSLIPMFMLRTKWGQKDNPDYKEELFTDVEDYLCGMVKIQTADHKYKTSGHGEWHGFVLKFTQNFDLEITWSVNDFSGRLEGDERKEMCEQTASQLHGGRAHAEPN
jgi:hypothetical protein